MLSMARRGLAKPTPPIPAPPSAVNDTRNIASNETTVSVAVLANDENVESATVTIQGSVTGANAVVSGQNINVTRIGTSAGSYSLTYRATTAAGFSQATLSGSIAAVSGGTVGPIEPVNGSLLQVAISVNTSARQTWHGYGFGLNTHQGAIAAFSRAQTHVTKLCEDLNSTVIRPHTPESSSSFLTAYKPWWDLMKNHGVDTVFSSSYIYRASPDTTPTAMANGIHACINGGMNPSLWVCSMQNEPDGHPDNAVTGGTSSYVPHHTELRNRLNALGRQAVKIISLEWRHPTAGGVTEFDVLNAAGAVSPNGIVTGGCIHIYDKSSDNNLYDNRYLAKGCHLWSTECGNNINPGCQARFLAGVNHGTVAEIHHIPILTSSMPTSEQLAQTLLEQNGAKRPWYGGVQVISTNLVRGTVIRLCQSSDRPPGLNTTHADRMIRNPGASTTKSTPRQQVIAGRRPDGKWVIAAVNATYGEDFFPTPVNVSNHYGAVAQQLTVTIPELSGLDRAFSAKRADINGSVSGPATVNLKNGVMRFTLQPGETIGMTST